MKFPDETFVGYGKEFQDTCDELYDTVELKAVQEYKWDFHVYNLKPLGLLPLRFFYIQIKDALKEYVVLIKTIHLQKLHKKLISASLYSSGVNSIPLYKTSSILLCLTGTRHTNKLYIGKAKGSMTNTPKANKGLANIRGYCGSSLVAKIPVV